MVEIKTGWVSQLTPKTHIVIDEEIKTNNCSLAIAIIIV